MEDVRARFEKWSKSSYMNVSLDRRDGEYTSSDTRLLFEVCSAVSGRDSVAETWEDQPKREGWHVSRMGKTPNLMIFVHNAGPEWEYYVKGHDDEWIKGANRTARYLYIPDLPPDPPQPKAVLTVEVSKKLANWAGSVGLGHPDENQLSMILNQAATAGTLTEKPTLTKESD